MKKLLFGLLATVAFLSNSFGQNNEFLKSELYGKYHNEFLKIYYEKYSNVKDKDFKIMFNDILSEFEKKYPDLISAQEKEFYAKRVDEIFGSNTKLTNLNFNDIFNRAAKKYYSPKLQEFLIDILNKNESPDIITDKISILKNDKTLSIIDLEEVKKFESVYISSQLYWENDFSNTENVVSKYKCNPHHQAFLADAGGMMFGGWGCLIFSAFVVDLQDQHGGGCI